MTLWTVRMEVEITVCVVAETKAEAETIARREGIEELRDACADSCHCRVATLASVREIPEDWADAAPLGANGDRRTVAERVRSGSP